MKLDEVRKLASVILPFTPESQQQIQDHLLSLGIDPSKLYQELEMSSQYVNTHRDVTYFPRPVSLLRFSIAAARPVWNIWLVPIAINCKKATSF